MTERVEADRLQQLIELGPALVAELDLESLLERVLETACSVTRARYAALGILDANRRELERFITHGLSDEEERAIGPRPRGRGVLGLLIEDAQPLRIGDVGAHPDSFGVPAGHPQMRSFLGVPILIRGRAWGNLYLTDKLDGKFDEADERVVVILASWAAIGIEHARLLADARDRQRELERAVRRLEATQAVAIAVGAETELERVLELIAKRGRALIEARSLLILLREGDQLVLASAAGHVQAEPGLRMAISETTSGHLMMAGCPARIEDPAVALRYPPERLGVFDARAALVVPLIYRGDAHGVIIAFDHGIGETTFSEEDEQVLISFAASAATAVVSARTVQADRLRHALDASEAERRHWARELHDETLQSLGSLKVLASAARRRAEVAWVREALEGLVEGLDDQIESVQTMISELRPAALDDLGLRPAVEALAERHAGVHGIEVECGLALPDRIERAQRLSPELETTVYRLVQEALSNAGKHSQATRIRVGVTAGQSAVEVEVVDDGVGFDPAASRTGFGLTGMHERVELVGGTLVIQSGAEGTAVRARLPYGGR